MDPFKPMEPIDPNEPKPFASPEWQYPQEGQPFLGEQENQQVFEQIPEQPPVSGYYHGVGVGQRETVYEPQSYAGYPGYDAYQPQQPYEPQQSYQGYAAYDAQPHYQPQQPQEAPTGKKKSVGKKMLKGTLLLIIAAALVVVSCGGTALVTGFIWQYQLESQLAQQSEVWREYMNDKLGVYEEEIGQLQDQINDLEGQVNGSGGQLISPNDTLSAGEIYQQNVNSVVAISCSVVTNSNGQNYNAISAGTGFIITEDGYIVTNHHVIEGASAINVIMENGDKYTAQVVGSDAANDVALLKINATGLDPVTIGSSAQLRVGDQVVAIGNALGELSSSLTVGYVSGMDRSVSTDGSIINMIQTDAAINSGNSGGPLFNAKGEVVGITSAKYSGTTSSGASIEGIGFAIPMDDVLELLQDLVDYGYVKSAYLGIYASDVDPNTADYYGFPTGVYVSSVEPGYCAAKAGLREKDIIVEIGGYKVTCLNDLGRALRKLEPGETVSVVVWRSGQEMILTITLDERPQS